MPPSPAPSGNASGPARCRRSSGEGEAVRGLRVLGIDLVGPAQEVECPQAVALSTQDGAQVLEIRRVAGVCGQGPGGESPGLGYVAFLLIDDAPVELAEVHIAEAQVVEKIGIIGILMEELRYLISFKNIL